MINGDVLITMTKGVALELVGVILCIKSRDT